MGELKYAKYVSIRVWEDYLKQLRQEASDEGLSVSGHVREILEEHCISTTDDVEQEVDED